MKLKLFATLLAAGTLALGALAIGSQPSSAQTTTYSCDTSRDGVPTTYALTATGRKVAVIRWVKNWGGKYTPEVRCREVSEKFQSASEQGLLKYLTYGIKSGQKVICVAGEYGGPCQQILFTLRSNENPDLVLQDMMSVGFRAQGPVVQSEDGSPQYYYDFEKFIEKAPTEE
jgi:hypothetical protein